MRQIPAFHPWTPEAYKAPMPGSILQQAFWLFVLAIPDMDKAAASGWGVFFFTLDAVLPATLKEILYVLVSMLTWIIYQVVMTARGGGWGKRIVGIACISPRRRSRLNGPSFIGKLFVDEYPATALVRVRS